MTRRWYQNIAINRAEFEDPKRKESKFWNEGKWDNFIKPLLPQERGVFIDIGCNAGLFLKTAVDEGFRDVYGVESNGHVMEQAERFREQNGYPYKLIHQTVGKNLDLDQLPLADVVLLSNTHYYIPIPAFANLVDRLKSKAVYCIVVSGKARGWEGCPRHHFFSTKGYFNGWQVARVIEGLEEGGDPAPRKQMWSALFKGNLDVCNIENKRDEWHEAALKSKNPNHFELPPALEEFFKKVLSEKEFDSKKTLLYKYWRRRMPTKSPEWTLKKLAYKQSLAEDIRDNGMKEPVYFDWRGKILDGIHRLAIARELGYGHIIIRRI